MRWSDNKPNPNLFPRGPLALAALAAVFAFATAAEAAQRGGMSSIGAVGPVGGNRTGGADRPRRPNWKPPIIVTVPATTAVGTPGTPVTLGVANSGGGGGGAGASSGGSNP